MKTKSALGAVAIAIALSLTAALGVVIAAEDKFALKSPNGIAFSEFEGYETWETVSVSVTDEVLNTIVANPVMIQAYKDGIPGNGKPFPDGSKIAKIGWSKREDPASPFTVDVPSQLVQVGFILKDAKRFPDSAGWGFAQLKHDAAAGTSTAEGEHRSFGVRECFQCHTRVKEQDYIFHPYAKK